MKITMKFDDIDPVIEVVSKKLLNLRPVMRRIAEEELAPLIEPAWDSSGLVSRSGELKKAVVPWVRIRSAGIRLKTQKKNDLILSKAVAMQRGSKAHAHKKSDTYRVKSRRGKVFSRKNLGSPWGAVKSRVFIPQKEQLYARKANIERIINDYLRG